MTPEPTLPRNRAKPAAVARARRWLWLAMALFAAFGALHGWCSGTGQAVPRALDMAFWTATAIGPYLWLRDDAAERGLPRGLYVSGAVIYLPWLAVPWYLLTRRPRGQRLRALVRGLGFGLLLVALYLLAGAPLAWWLGGW